MWIPFDNNDFDNQRFGNFPSEGYDVMVTNGEQEYIMWYVMSGTYKWFCVDPCDIDNSLSGDELPFHPTHWMDIDDYKLYNRDNKINQIIGD